MKRYVKLVWEWVGVKFGFTNHPSVSESSNRISGYLRGRLDLPVYGRSETNDLRSRGQRVIAIREGIRDMYSNSGIRVDVKEGKVFVYEVEPK